MRNDFDDGQVMNRVGRQKPKLTSKRGRNVDGLRIRREQHPDGDAAFHVSFVERRQSMGNVPGCRKKNRPRLFQDHVPSPRIVIDDSGIDTFEQL